MKSKIYEYLHQMKFEILSRIVSWVFKKFAYLFELNFNIKGLKAIHSPHTGIVDWGLVARHYGSFFENLGGKIKLNFEVDEFSHSPIPSHPIRIVSKNKNVCDIHKSFNFLILHYF
jgi:L-2-hydroxyglutarate oxidase LhgO